jgi:hypothetical protein
MRYPKIPGDARFVYECAIDYCTRREGLFEEMFVVGGLAHKVYDKYGDYVYGKEYDKDILEITKVYMNETLAKYKAEELEMDTCK